MNVQHLIRKTIWVGMPFLMSVPTVWACDSFIDDYNGERIDFSITDNQGKEKDIQILPNTSLQGVKTITVKGKTAEDHEVYISLNLGGQMKRLTHKDTKDQPYPVNASSGGNDCNTGLSAWFGEQEEKVKEEKKSTHIKTVNPNSSVSTPPDLVVPMLQNAKLVAKTREVYIGWYGGQPPYRVEVYLNENQQPSKELADPTREFQTPYTKLNKQQFTAKSRYTVKIFPKKGKSEKGTFEVVMEQPNLPKIVKKQIDGNTQFEGITQLACAVAKEGEWALEAYQGIAPITDYRVAILANMALRRQSLPTNCK